MELIATICKHLPNQDCGRCGSKSCRDFAKDLLNHEKGLNDCPLLLEGNYAKSLEDIVDLLKPIFDREKSKMRIKEELCYGCGNCVASCPANAGLAINATILVVEGGRTKIVDIDHCYRFDPRRASCRACIEVCPSGAIEFG